MGFSFALVACGVAQLALARGQGVLALPLVWTAASFLLAAAGYAKLGPGVFGKRPDGKLPSWRTLLLLPYLLFTWTVWHLQRLLSTEPACSEVSPGIWLGRRPFAHELPPGVALVVDLTAEFPEPREVVSRCAYLCLPCLDGLVPDEKAFKQAVGHIASCEGEVYIHCALGHGRSATLAVAAMVARNLAADVAEAEQIVKQARPRIALSRPQRRLLAVLYGEPCALR